MNITTITSELVANLNATLYDENGEISEEASATLDAWDAEFKKKADAYAYVIDIKTADANFLKNEIDRLKKRLARETNTIEWLRSRIMVTMKRLGIQKLATSLHNFTIARNGGLAPMTIAVEPSKLPAKYVREIPVITFDVDKALLRKDLEMGIKIEGVTLGERGENLRIG